MAKLFTLTIIPKVIVEGKVLSSNVIMDGEDVFPRIEATFDDSNIEDTIHEYLSHSVGVHEKELNVIFDKIYLEKDNLIGHIYILYKIYGYSLSEVEMLGKFKLVEECEFMYGKI